MPHNRFFVDQNLNKGDEITLQDAEFKHFHVMRVQKEDMIELVNGKGQLAIAKVHTKEQKKAKVKIYSIQEEIQSQRYVLALAFIKTPLLEWVLEKSTELGITEFWLFQGEKSLSIRLSQSKLHRFRQIFISSMKQCGRLFLPTLQMYDSLKELPSFPGTKFYGEITTTKILKKVSSPSMMVIGPESGFSKNEKTFLDQNHFQKTRLHKNILRAETAAIIGSYFITES